MKQIIADPLDWPDTYAEWLKNAEKKLAAASRAGFLITKIEADPDDFLAWCKVKACRPDSTARRLYAVEKFSESDKRNV